MNNEVDNEIEIELKKLGFDLYGRYAIIKEIINFNRLNNESYKILDVGGRGNLLKKFLPNDKVYYLEPDLDSVDENYIKGDGCEIPFENESFDWIVSADVYEHIPREKRDLFIEEQLRVAKLGVILGVPFFSNEVEIAEKDANEIYRLLYNEDHVWLKEHIEFGLPRLEELVKKIKSKKLGIQIISNNYLYLWGILLPFTFIFNNSFYYNQLKEKFENFNLFYNTEVFPCDQNKLSYRKILIIKKNKKIKYKKNKNEDDTIIDTNLFLRTIKKYNELLINIENINKVTRNELERTRNELERIRNSYKYRIALKLEKIAQKTGLIYLFKWMVRFYEKIFRKQKME